MTWFLPFSMWFNSWFDRFWAKDACHSHRKLVVFLGSVGLFPLEWWDTPCWVTDNRGSYPPDLEKFSLFCTLSLSSVLLYSIVLWKRGKRHAVHFMINLQPLLYSRQHSVADPRCLIAGLSEHNSEKDCHSFSQLILVISFSIHGVGDNATFISISSHSECAGYKTGIYNIAAHCSASTLLKTISCIYTPKLRPNIDFTT